MPIPHPIYDRALAALASLEEYAELPDADLDAAMVTRCMVEAQHAQMLANLAIAEALHGVVYVGNSNAV